MARGKKKKPLSLLILLIVLSLLLVVMVQIKKRNDKTGEEGSEESINENIADEKGEIINVDKDSIAEIYFKNQYVEMSFVKKDEDSWLNASDESFPVAVSNIDTINNNISSVTYSRKIENSEENLSEYGLDTPEVEARITMEDGTETRILFGIQAPFDEGYYAMVNDDPAIYLVNSVVYNAFLKTEKDMLEVEDLPDIIADNIEYVKIDGKDGVILEMSYEKDPVDLAGTNNWNILKPYEKPVAGDTMAITEYLNNYSNLSFDECVDYRGEDLSQYGLDEPALTIYLNYFETIEKEETSSKEEQDTSDEELQEPETIRKDHTLELYIGSVNEEGDYYVKQKESNAVYTMSGDKISNLIEINTFSLMDKFQSMINIQTVDNVNLTIGTTTHTMDIIRTTETTDDQEEEKEEYRFDNESVEEEKFKDLYQALISPKIERELPEEYVKEDTIKPELSVTFNRNTDSKSTVTIEYFPYDESYYIMKNSEDMLFLVDLRVINDIIDSIKNFTS